MHSPQPAPSAGCGGCNACCFLLEIDEPELTKPGRKWCPHVLKGRGCGIYENRPPVCRRFKCLWLESQDGASPDGSITWDVMPPEMRPDRCGVMFAAIDPDHPDTRIHAHVNPVRPSSWLRGDVQAWMLRMLTRGITIGLHVGDKFTALTPTTHLRPKGIKK